MHEWASSFGPMKRRAIVGREVRSTCRTSCGQYGARYSVLCRGHGSLRCCTVYIPTRLCMHCTAQTADHVSIHRRPTCASSDLAVDTTTDPTHTLSKHAGASVARFQHADLPFRAWTSCHPFLLPLSAVSACTILVVVDCFHHHRRPRLTRSCPSHGRRSRPRRRHHPRRCCHLARSHRLDPMGPHLRQHARLWRHVSRRHGPWCTSPVLLNTPSWHRPLFHHALPPLTDNTLGTDHKIEMARPPPSPSHRRRPPRLRPRPHARRPPVPPRQRPRPLWRLDLFPHGRPDRRRHLPQAAS